MHLVGNQVRELSHQDLDHHYEKITSTNRKSWAGALDCEHELGFNGFILFILGEQFGKFLDRHYGTVIKPKESVKLMEKYGSDPCKPEMVNYRDFSKAVDPGK